MVKMKNPLTQLFNYCTSRVFLSQGATEWFILFTEAAELPEFIIFKQEKVFFLIQIFFLNKNWIYFDKFLCGFSDTIIKIYKIAKLMEVILKIL